MCLSYSLSELPIPLPCFDRKENDSFTYTSNGIQRISADDLFKLVNSGSEVHIFDCRFQYEFQAGHMIGATNLTRLSQLRTLFENADKIAEQMASKSKTMNNYIIAFHCEFSANRGPTWAQIFRDMDRKSNIRNYPFLSFPKVFIIEGGYKLISMKYPEKCIGCYRPMREQGAVDSGELSRSHTIYQKETNKYRHREPEKRPAIRYLSFSQPNFSLTNF